MPKKTKQADAINTILQGDCVAELRKMPAGSVDLAFADPPFNIGYTYDVYDDRRSADEYLDWSRAWMSEITRVLRPDGAFWLAIGDEFAAELKVLATRDLGLVCRNWVVWYYTFGVHCHSKFTRSHAHMFYFVKQTRKAAAGANGRKPRKNGTALDEESTGSRGITFNDSAIRVPSARQLVYADSRANPAGRVPDDTWLIPPKPHDSWILRPQDIPDGFAADSDTWYFPRVCGTFKERMGFHGCQMPEQLLGRIVRACSDPDDLVLDPFSGSGTTLAVAKKLGRRLVGLELSPDYVRQGLDRLARITPGDPLDGVENPLLSTVKTAEGRRLGETGKRGPAGKTARPRRGDVDPQTVLPLAE
jgi:site-specific DNA-methyltransferase (adenine-specific)